MDTNVSIIYYIASALLAFTVLGVAIRRNRRSLKYLRGPKPSSFWLGMPHYTFSREIISLDIVNRQLGDLRYQKEVGDKDFSWMTEYGSAWRINGVLGEEELMVADPKALQYILQTSGYRFPKKTEIVATFRFILGEGIVWAHGEQHQRHRKIMTPAFFAPQLRTFLSLFLRAENKVSQKWKDEILANDESEEPVLNVHKWLSRTTLDVIGEAGFDFDFGALDESENPLNKIYDNLFVDSTLYPRKSDIVFRAFWRYLPTTLVNFFRYLPSREYSRFRRFLDFIQDFAKTLVASSSAKGDGKDIMSREVIDQISTILLAGHDTTASTLSWWLWELAKHPESQTKMREEVAAVRAKVEARGETEFNIADLEGMSYMQATLKEGMRLHPIVWELGRVAGQDDVIPLASPVTTKTGEEISSIPVKKGQYIHISICGYNRLPSVWGDDAHEWNPDRFLNMDKAKQTSVGVYANLLNFSAGIRGCIGWRFAVIEMQAIAATLIENFEFALPPDYEKNKIKRMPTGVMAPMVDGNPNIWMGLKVKVLQ
ncbi:cytochrome P450 [Amylostereum chailletii]|nr:cytochrome P450 [Amylostereum chailletii]